MKKYIVEFIGTFFLILTITLSVNSGLGNFAPLAIGAILMVMIYSGGHISGAHFNPAVTLGVFLRGKCSASDIPGYVIAQLIGGVLAALAGKVLLGYLNPELSIVTAPPFDTIGGGLAEFLGTFALVWVILQVATAKGTEGNSFYGLAIGFTVTACAYALGGITGGAFNPAVVAGISVIEMSALSNIPVFLVAQLLAGAAAAFMFKFVNAEQRS